MSKAMDALAEALAEVLSEALDEASAAKIAEVHLVATGKLVDASRGSRFDREGVDAVVLPCGHHIGLSWIENRKHGVQTVSYIPIHRIPGIIACLERIRGEIAVGEHASALVMPTGEVFSETAETETTKPAEKPVDPPSCVDPTETAARESRA